jgi:hypothetical protein
MERRRSLPGSDWRKDKGPVDSYSAYGKGSFDSHAAYDKGGRSSDTIWHASKIRRCDAGFERRAQPA